MKQRIFLSVFSAFTLNCTAPVGDMPAQLPGELPLSVAHIAIEPDTKADSADAPVSSPISIEGNVVTVEALLDPQNRACAREFVPFSQIQRLPDENGVWSLTRAVLDENGFVQVRFTFDFDSNTSTAHVLARRSGAPFWAPVLPGDMPTLATTEWRFSGFGSGAPDRRRDVRELVTISNTPELFRVVEERQHDEERAYDTQIVTFRRSVLDLTSEQVSLSVTPMRETWDGYLPRYLMDGTEFSCELPLAFN